MDIIQGMLNMWQKVHQVTFLTEGLLSHKFKSNSGTVSKRRQSFEAHKRSGSLKLPVIIVKSYKNPGLEPRPSRPRTSVPNSTYKLLVCDILQTDTCIRTPVPLCIATQTNLSEC